MLTEPPTETTGHPSVDALFRKARELGASFEDLDRVVGSADFFRSGRWRAEPDSPFVVAALEALSRSDG